MTSLADRPTSARPRPEGLRPRSTRRRVGPLLAISGAIAFALMMALAAAPLWPIYRSDEFLVLLATALLVGSVIALGGLFLRLPSFGVLLATVVAFGLFGVAVAVPGRALYGVVPTPAGLYELVQGAALGWKQLITITLPVGDYQALLVPAFVLLLPGTVIGLSTALRSRRPELAVVPPVVVYLVGVVLGPAVAVLPIVTGLALLAACILWLVWWRLRRRRAALARAGVTTRDSSVDGRSRTGTGPLARRAVVGTAITLVLAAGLSTAATAALAPSGSRWVARTAVAQPFDPRDYDSPLSGFRAYEQTPTATQAQVRVTGLPRGALLRVATLDTYDGVVFSVGSAQVSSESGSFSRVPTSFDQSAVRGSQMRVGVTIEGYSGVWLPTVGKLESIDFSGSESGSYRDDFFYNDASGTAAVIGGVGRGVSYELHAVDPRQPTAAQLATVTPGRATVPTPTGVPSVLKSKLAGYISGVDGQGARLAAAIEGLKTTGYVSHGVGKDEPVSRSGHGADRLTELFTDSVMVGDAEQYAAAAALMADQLGFPARVVMGFAAPTDASAADSSAGGAVDLTGADVTARIEVDTAQYGWVSIDPNPPVRAIPKDDSNTSNEISKPESVVQPPPEDNEPQTNQTPPQSSQDDPELPSPLLGLLRIIGVYSAWVLLVAGIVMAPFIAVVAVKARRRFRRRRLPDPGRRLSAGWQEFRDAVVDHDIETPPSATRLEVAEAVGGARSAVLARVVDRSVFAPEAASAVDADRVWKAVGDMRGQLDRDLTRWQRFRAATSLRSLRGYHGGTTTKR